MGNNYFIMTSPRYIIFSLIMILLLKTAIGDPFSFDVYDYGSEFIVLNWTAVNETSLNASRCFIGNPFDQDLNTYDDPTFDNITVGSLHIGNMSICGNDTGWCFTGNYSEAVELGYCD